MYFIGLFYDNGNQIKSNSIQDTLENYSLNDMLIVFWSLLIMIALNAILMQIMKLKPIDPHMPREVFLAVLKYNYRKNLVVFFILLGIFTYFCWSIAMFTLHLDTFTSYKWILNTSVSFVISLIFSPFVKVIIVNILFDSLVQRLKAFRKRESQMTSVLPCDDSIDPMVNE